MFQEITIIITITQIIKATPALLVQSLLRLTLGESVPCTSSCLDTEGGTVSKTAQSLPIQVRVHGSGVTFTQVQVPS